ncbi:MAG: hypothetical protein HWE23_08305 [Rhodobacteraceae bacterium]|nr:hypothetical protein [Paracoccaceae bacterium]
MNQQAAQVKGGHKDLEPAEGVEEREDKEEAPALHLAGLQFFFADINNKMVMWHEHGSQSFENSVPSLLSAPTAEAFRLLSVEDRKTVLHLIQGAIQKGKAGPYSVGRGVDQRIPGVPLMAFRYELADGRLLVVCYPSAGEADNSRGTIALGLAPILQHFVANSNRSVMLVDNFGYVRFVSEGLINSFQVDDIRLILGRNIAHIQSRIGRSLSTIILETLARRANASGRGRFLLANGETFEAVYNTMFFSIAGSFGGAMFSAGDVSGDVDYAQVFNMCSAPMIIVNTESKRIMTANKSAMKIYHLKRDDFEDRPITETLLHPKSYATLLAAANEGNQVPQSVVVNSQNGQSKKKRLKATLVRGDKAPKLVLEART